MRIKTLLLVTVLCLAAVPASRAQDPAPPPPAGPMVGLSLIVADKDGKGVNTIRTDQIRVIEEGAEQTVLGKDFKIPFPHWTFASGKHI